MLGLLLLLDVAHVASCCVFQGSSPSATRGHMADHRHGTTVAGGKGSAGTFKDKPPSSRSSSHSRGDTGTAAAKSAGNPRGDTRSPKGSPRKHKKGVVPEMGIKNMEVMSDDSVLQTVEILKRPGQTLGFYIREGNGSDRNDGVFISRIAPGSVVENNGLLKVGDEILVVNSVDVTKISLDDVVILMSIPKRLVLQIRTRRGQNSKNNSCPSLCTIEQEEPNPVVVLKNRCRSSSATAVEMTDKCPDEFIMPAGAEHTTYYKQPPAPPGYNLIKHMEDAAKIRGKSPPKSSSSQYGLLPASAGYKLSVVGGDRVGVGYQGDDSGDSGLSSENSGYSAAQSGGTGPSTSTSTAGGPQYPGGGVEGSGGDIMNDGLVAKHGDIMYDHSTKRSPKLSQREPTVTFRSPVATRRGVASSTTSPYVHLEYASDTDAAVTMTTSRYLLEADHAAAATLLNRPRIYDANSIRAFQEEIERTHHKYAHIAAASGHKYHKVPARHVSPDRYNSDSEVITGTALGYPRKPPSPSVGKEYLSHLLDVEDRCNSLPHMQQTKEPPSHSSEQLKHWLRKFDTFSGSFDAPTHPQDTLQAPHNAGRCTYLIYWAFSSEK